MLRDVAWNLAGIFLGPDFRMRPKDEHLQRREPFASRSSQNVASAPCLFRCFSAPRHKLTLRVRSAWIVASATTKVGGGGLGIYYPKQQQLLLSFYISFLDVCLRINAGEVCWNYFRS